MIHYHGLPITPQSVLAQLAGLNFCVSYAARSQVAIVHDIGQSVMLDNGAFSFWKSGKATDWDGYYDWAEHWLAVQTTWAVIPDVIGGTAEENDALIDRWPHGDRGAPVWHTDERVDRLLFLANDWPRVCIGSAAGMDPGTPQWHRVMERAMNALCGNGPVPIWLHMLRGMSLSGSEYPFASVDSTDIARNHNRGGDVVARARYWDAKQNPASWTEREQLELADLPFP